MNRFTFEELTLICIYSLSDRTQLISDIRKSMRYVDDPEMTELMQTVISKLDIMTDTEYSEMNFSLADEIDISEN